ncbi:hypothetical protein BMETH_1695_0 [methanotrophic bacterial endosymbiont of Bathymodiolus sp.]|nr:hypothetical protein BMETH_1695_0 [methanotrophic bacterial endosymbiont of Bathymodiolus sp.]
MHLYHHYQEKPSIQQEHFHHQCHHRQEYRHLVSNQQL